MTTPINSILRKVLRKPGDPLDIFVYPHDGYYERNLCLTGHNFYTPEYPHKNKPDNLHILSDNPKQIPLYLNVDLVILNHRLAHYDKGRIFGNFMHVPMILVDHWHPANLKREVWESVRNNTSADLVVSTTELMQKAWALESHIVNYGVELFDNQDIEKDDSIFLYGHFPVSDYYIIKKLIDSHNVIVRGKNPGLSEDIPEEELLMFLRKAKIYINLSSEHTVSYQLLRAMAAGCCIISNKMDVLDGVLNSDNSIVCTHIEEFNETINTVNAAEFGNRAREYIKQYHNLGAFRQNWNNIIKLVDTKVFRK